MRKTIQIRASVIFIRNLNSLYPNLKSIRLRTERLNEEIEKFLSEKKK